MHYIVYEINCICSVLNEKIAVKTFSLREMDLPIE